MIVSQTGGRKVTIRRRDPETLDRVTEVIEQYPYCFAENVGDRYGLAGVEHGYEGAYGKELSKVLFRTNYDRRMWAKGSTTWEAKVPYTYQVLNDMLAQGKKSTRNI